MLWRGGDYEPRPGSGPPIRWRHVLLAAIAATGPQWVEAAWRALR